MRGYNDVLAAAYAVADEGVGGSDACRAALVGGHKAVGALFGDASGRARLATLFGQTPDWCVRAIERVSKSQSRA